MPDGGTADRVNMHAFSLPEELATCRAQGAQIGDRFSVGKGTVLCCGSPGEVTIGQNVRIGQNSTLVFDRLTIGDNVTIGSNVDIRSSCVEIGDNTAVDNNVDVLTPVSFAVGNNSNIGGNISITCREFRAKDHLQLYSDVTIGEGGKFGVNARVTIGKACFIGKGCLLNPSEEILIGDDVGMGQQCMIWTHGGYLSALDGFPAAFSPVRIGSHVWIPARTIVLPGVTIGSNVVLGIGSLVNRDIPSNCLAAGVPARVLRDDCYPKKLSEEELERLMRGIIARYIPLKQDKNIGGKILYDPVANAVVFAREVGKTVYDLKTMTIVGETDEETEDFRDFLRRNGIKFFTDRKFESIIPPAFARFMDATR